MQISTVTTTNLLLSAAPFSGSRAIDCAASAGVHQAAGHTCSVGFCGSPVDFRIGFLDAALSGANVLSISAHPTIRRSISPFQSVSTKTASEITNTKPNHGGFLRRPIVSSNSSPLRKRCKSFHQLNHTNKTTDLGRACGSVSRRQERQVTSRSRLLTERDTFSETTTLKSTNKNQLRLLDSETSGLQPACLNVSQNRFEQKTTYYEKRNVDQHVSNRGMSDCDRGRRPARRTFG